MATLIPNDAQPIAGPGGTVTTPWRQFLDALSRGQASGEAGNAELAADIRAIAIALGSPDGTVENIPDQSREAGLIIGQGSIKTVGTLANGKVWIQLQGDESGPGPTYYYGADATGTKGWHAVADTVEAEAGDLTKTVDADGVITFGLADLADSGTGALLAITRDAKGRVSGTKAATITGTAGRVTVDDGDAVAGLPTIDLAEVADAGGGEIRKFDRDGYGRVTGTSAATTDDLDEGATNLYFTDARASAAAPIQSIVAGDNIEVDVTDPENPVINAEAATTPGHIDGLRLRWVSATALTVTSGSAYIEGAGAVLEAPSAIAKTSLSLATSTWVHVYLYDNSGTPDIELSTTAPATAYNGVARSKTGDTSRRYLGSVRTDVSGNIYAFRHIGNSIAYLTGTSQSPFRVLSNGTVATTETTVSAANAVPLTSTEADVRIVNQRNDTATFGNTDDNIVLTQASFLLRVPASNEAYPSLQLSTTQDFTYYLAGTTGGLFVDIRGYTFER